MIRSHLARAAGQADRPVDAKRPASGSVPFGGDLLRHPGDPLPTLVHRPRFRIRWWVVGLYAISFTACGLAIRGLFLLIAFVAGHIGALISRVLP